MDPESSKTIKKGYQKIIREAKRRASDAGSSAQTAQQIGVGVGAPLATGGLLSLAATSASLAPAGMLATMTGVVVTAVGFIASHYMNKKKHAQQEIVEEYQDKMGDLK